MNGDAQRLQELETRSMYQEVTIAQLSDLVAEQENRIRWLEESLRAMAGRVKEMADGKDDNNLPHERPPHY